jgi:DNA-binding XRE family transcriptional regulator
LKIKINSLIINTIKGGANMSNYEYNNLYDIEERKQLIAVKLIKLRTEQAKKQKEVAEAIGVKPTT